MPAPRSRVGGSFPCPSVWTRNRQPDSRSRLPYLRDWAFSMTRVMWASEAFMRERTLVASWNSPRSSKGAVNEVFQGLTGLDDLVEDFGSSFGQGFRHGMLRLRPQGTGRSWGAPSVQPRTSSTFSAGLPRTALPPDHGGGLPRSAHTTPSEELRDPALQTVRLNYIKFNT